MMSYVEKQDQSHGVQQSEGDLNWLGYLVRLTNDTPAKKIALNESLKQKKENIRRSPTTWIELIEKDLSTVNIKIDIKTKSIKDWKRIVKDIMVESR